MEYLLLQKKKKKLVVTNFYLLINVHKHKFLFLAGKLFKNFEFLKIKMSGNNY